MAKGSKGTGRKPASRKGAGPVKKGSGSQRAKPAKHDDSRPAASDGLQASGRNPVYVLVILVLITVIVFLVNKVYFGGISPVKKADVETVKTPDKTHKADPHDQKNPQKDKAADKKDIGGDDKTARQPDGLFPEREYKLYYLRFDEKTEKASLAAVRRKMKTDEPLTVAMRELIKGPSAKEEKAGMLSALPRRLTIRNVAVRNRIATIDFNEALEEGAIGHIAQNRVDQIVFTATQFEGVEGIIIQINGKTVRFLGGDGLALNIPLKRKPGKK